MDYKESLQGIQLNVEASNVTVTDDVKSRIRIGIGRLQRYYSEINRADIFLEDKEGKSTDQKKVSIRLSIPGNDAFASEYGSNFNALLSDVEEKLRRQLEKSK